MADKFPGIPAGSPFERKLERCVKKVKAQGKDKSSAIAICRSSLKKEVKMQKTRKGKTPRQRRKERQRINGLTHKEVQKFAEAPVLELEVESEDAVEEKEFELGPEFALVEGETFSDIPDEIIEETIDEFDEAEEKHGHLSMSMPDSSWAENPGPKSLDELETKREARKKIQEVRNVTWDTEDVISNIINDPETDVDKKASQISSVAGEMKAKINKVLGKTKEFEEEEFDWDVAQLEILARELTLYDQFKAVLNSGALKKLPDSAFAFVEDRDGKVVRKFPTHDKSHVRSTLAQAAQMIKKGGQAGADAKSALTKIRAAAKETGIGQPSKKNYNGFLIEKDTNGDYRWVGWATNNRVDKDGDILTDVGHKEFVEFLHDHPNWQIKFLPWHQKQHAFSHPVDAWVYKNGFMIYSGKLEEDEAIRLTKMSQKERLGMSHGFIPLHRKEKLIEKFRTFEVSVLPLHNAANPYTSLEVIAKEANIVDKEKYLRDLLGDENFETLAEATDTLKDVLDDAGVQAKDVDDTKAKPEEKETDDEKESFSPEEKTVVDKISAALGMNDLSVAFKAMAKEIADGRDERKLLATGIKALLDRQKVMEDEVEKDATDRLTEMIASPASKQFAWQEQRPSQSKDNELDEKDAEDAEVLKARPKLWLSEITETEPLPKQYVESNA